MNSNPPSVLAVSEDISFSDRHAPAWGAIIAGAVAGLAVHLLLMTALSAVGLGLAHPGTDDNPVATFGVGTAVAWTIAALVSLFIGGWIAGRCAARVHSVSGAVHGFLVWCLGAIAAALMLALGAGAVVGGAARVVSEGARAIGQPVAGMADLVRDAAAQNASAISSMIDEAAQSPQIRENAGRVAAARREIGQAVRQLFRNGGDVHDPAARNDAVQALTRAGVPQADAERQVDGWIASMDRARAQFEQTRQAAVAKARDVADRASAAISRAALWTFIGFVIGAFAATMGGRRGQRWEFRHTEIGADASLDPATRRAPLPVVRPV